MRWIGIVALMLAVLVRFGWRNSPDLSFSVNASTHEGYPVSLLMSWVLLMVGVSLLSLSLAKRA